MNRIQTACYCLIASALVLSGLLVVQLSERVEPNSAEAALVIAREIFTLMTAEVRSVEVAPARRRCSAGSDLQRRGGRQRG